MTDGHWMTYADAGVRLGINAEAVRRRADRGKWARMPGNDGRTRVRVPDEVRASQAPPVRADMSALVSALEDHVTTLKAELAAERTRADRATAELIELARQLATIATAEAEPEPPRGSLGRAWRWLLRN